MKSLSNFFSNLSTKHSDAKRVVGIDIGSSSIKVVEIQNRDDVLTLTTYGELQLGPYANQEIGQSVVLSPEKEQQALVDVLRESAVKASQAVFAMPLSSSFVTTINFDAGPEEDVSSRVRVESRKYIPVPIGEVTLDWAEIDAEGNTPENPKRSVLVAAIQNDALNRFKVLMQFVNLNEPPTEIECFSAIRGVYKEEEKDIALIDIGAISTKMYIARQGLLQRMHRVRAGGALGTKRIASALELTFEQAELLKRNTKIEDQNFLTIKQAHSSAYDRVWEEFAQVMEEYEETLKTKISTVYMTGGGSLFPLMQQDVEEALQKKVIQVNAFDKVAYPAFMEDMIAGLGPTFHVALGSALRLYE